MKKAPEPEYSKELMAIAARLKQLRKEKGYNNYEHIAFELNMSRSAYWRIESGKNFQMITLLKVCSLLEISVSDFFEGMDIPKPTKKIK